MIPDEIVERVREAADVAGIIGEYVDLRRVGADFRGPCPFHQGTHRNFSVSTKKGIYYCFVCHEGGDVFSFLQKRLGVDWPTAVKMVAERSGIEVREVDSRREASGPDPREPFWEINAAAGDYFRRMLWDDDAGREARDYLAQRRLTREVADRFGLGFAPREIGLLRGYLNTLGFDDARLLAAGLLVQPEEKSEPRPRFRGRLIFPIFDAAGHPVGFGGRLLGPGEPKYLNSPETPVFSKGKLLYALNWARQAARREERLLVVEGYFDVVRLMAAGIDAVVAPLGTALTEAQAALVRRYATNVFLLYDSDQPGLRATFRSGDELLRHGVSVQVVTLPSGEDPDTFVDQHGAKALEAQLGQSVDILERKIQLLERAGWFGDLKRKRRALDRLIPTLRATQDPLTRDMYLTRTSEVAGVSRELLLREIEAPAARGRVRHAGAERAAGGEGEDDGSGSGAGRGPRPAARSGADRRHASDRRHGERHGRREPAISAERELVRVMLHHRAQVEVVAERVGPTQFRSAPHRAIFQALLAKGGDASPDALAEELDEESLAELQRLLAEPSAVLHPARSVDQSVAAIRVRELDERLSEIDRELPLANDAQKDALIAEKGTIVQEVRALGGVGYRKYGKSRSQP